MKIGYLMQQGVEIRTPPFDGPATHVREVVEALTRLGHQVRVLVKLDGLTWRSDDLTTFTPVEVPWMERGPLRLVERAVRRAQYELKLPYAALFDSLRFALACRAALRGFNLLFERLSWMGYGGGLASRLMRIPLVLENNGDHLADLEAKGIAPEGVQRRLSLALMRTTVRRAARVVASGEGHRQAYLDRWNVAPESITTIENGSALLRLLGRDELRAFHDDSDAEPVTTLAYVGAFLPWHGLPVLLRAFARALATGLRLRLLLIGSGEGMEESRQLAQSLGLSESVHFAGHLSPQQFAPLLAGADIALSPYCGWREFSGLKLFDYKAAGLATIASGQDGQPATLRHEQTGLIVPPCDEEALAAAIIRLCAEPSLRRQMGRAARIEAEGSHGWEHTAQRLEQLFMTVTGKGAPAIAAATPSMAR